MRILTDDEVTAGFGDIHAFISQDGTIQWGWETKILTLCELPAPLPLSWNKAQVATHFKCHRRIVVPLGRVLRAIHAQPAAWATINDFGGCYMFRAQRKSKKLSRHSWAIAIDLDVGDNAFGDATPETDPRVRAAFEAEGFVWGGTFPPDRIDGQHFEVSDELLGRLGS